MSVTKFTLFHLPKKAQFFFLPLKNLILPTTLISKERPNVPKKKQKFKTVFPRNFTEDFFDRR